MGIQNYDGSYDYYAEGHYGQYIYVAPRRNIVVVRLGDWADEYPVYWPLILQSLVDQMD